MNALGDLWDHTASTNHILINAPSSLTEILIAWQATFFYNLGAYLRRWIFQTVHMATKEGRSSDRKKERKRPHP